MPGLDFGVYTGQLTAGTEVSSTYEGRHITVQEQELIHPYHLVAGLNLVQKGDPVLICKSDDHATYGKIVGVALATAKAVTDYIAVDTEGIWNLLVHATDDLGDSDIEPGDDIYIMDGSLVQECVAATGLGDAGLSKRRNIATHRHFGVALGRMVGADASGRIAVKVHFDPLDDCGVLFGDGEAAEVGENGRSAFAAEIHLDETDAFTEAVKGYVYWSEAVEGDEYGSPTGGDFRTGVIAGATIGGTGSVWPAGIKGIVNIAGTLNNSGTSYICGMQAGITGIGTVTAWNILTALYVWSNFGEDLRGGTNHSSMILLENNMLVNGIDSIFSISMPNTDYFFHMRLGTGGAWWVAGGTDCQSDGTDPVGCLRCIDPNGTEVFIRCYETA